MSDLAGHRKRLRARFKKNGLKGFHDYEIMELLLTYGIVRRDCKPLAKKLLEKHKSLACIFGAPSSSLMENDYIGENAAILIQLVKDIADAILKEKTLDMDYFNSFRVVSNYIRVSMGGLKHEEFRAAFLNSANGIIAIETIHHGTVNATLVHPREIIELAIKHHATGLICFHNHPGGNCQPSNQDRSLTRDILYAARPLGINFHDHLILAGPRIYSFASSGDLKILVKKYESIRTPK